MGAVFIERFIRTIRYLLKRPVFEKSESTWIDILPTIIKQYKNRIHSSTKLTQIQASIKKERKLCLPNFIRQKKKIKAENSSKRPR